MFFFFQAEDGIRDGHVTGVQTCALPISTLVNRLLGQREVIAHEQPGVTRDRVEVPVEWRGRTFVAVDTGGHVTKASGVEALAAAPAARAAEGADLVLLVVDVRTGVQEEDAALAR